MERRGDDDDSDSDSDSEDSSVELPPQKTKEELALELRGQEKAIEKLADEDEGLLDSLRRLSIRHGFDKDPRDARKMIRKNLARIQDAPSSDQFEYLPKVPQLRCLHVYETSSVSAAAVVALCLKRAEVLRRNAGDSTEFPSVEMFGAEKYRDLDGSKSLVGGLEVEDRTDMIPKFENVPFSSEELAEEAVAALEGLMRGWSRGGAASFSKEAEVSVLGAKLLDAVCEFLGFEKEKFSVCDTGTRLWIYADEELAQELERNAGFALEEP